MILFFELEVVDAVADEFFNRFRKKLLTPFNVVSSPYTKKELYQERNLYCFLLDIAWVKFYWFGLAGLIACAFFGLAWAWWILPGIMTSMFVLWHPGLYLLMFKKGLRKAGYKGKVVGISAESFMVRLIEWDK